MSGAAWERRTGLVRGSIPLDGGGPVSARQDAFHYRPSAGTLAEDVARERAISEAIERNPFCHIPARLRVR